MHKAAVYLCASKLDQTTGDHERELRGIASRMNWEIVKVYSEAENDATRQKRPQLKKLCQDKYNRKFDIVMVWSVDHLGRSLHDLVGFLSDIHALKIDLYLHKQGLDTTTCAGKAIFEMTNVFAEFERTIIRDRFRDGWGKAKRNGRLRGPRKIAPAIEDAIRDALRKGDAGMMKIASRFGVGTGTVQRIKAEMGASDPESTSTKTAASSSRPSILDIAWSDCHIGLAPFSWTVESLGSGSARLGTNPEQLFAAGWSQACDYAGGAQKKTHSAG